MNVALRIPKREFIDQLAKQWSQGQVIGAKYIPNDTDLKAFALLKREFDLWDSYNYDWLGHAFTDTPFSDTTNQIQEAYKRAGTINTDRANAIKRGMSPSSLPFQHMFFESWLLPKLDYLDSLQQKMDFFSVRIAPVYQPDKPNATLTHLHSAVQQVSSSLWANNHYRQAVLDSCIALDKAVQDKANLPATTTGKSLMTTAFSASKPLIRLSKDDNEQLGFMNLYQGSVQAIRNHYAHNLTEIPAPRALEWLSFVSALLYKLDEAE